MELPRIPRRMFAVAWLVATGAGACATGDRAATPTRIPFTLTQFDNIAVRGTLNGSESLDLLFHTGVDSVSLTRDAIARLARFDAKETVSVQSWGGTQEARHSTGNTLQIGDVVCRGLAITEDQNSGPGTDGKFGPSLFAGKIVEVDYDARQLVLHDTLPALDERWMPLVANVRDGGTYVDAEVVVGDRALTTTFLLHTGYHGTGLLDEEFVRANGLGDVLATIRENELHDSYGNVVKTREVRVPTLRLGPLAMKDVPVGVFEGKLGSGRTSVLGCAVLKRCNLVLDVANGRVWATPSRFANAPFAD